jgi:RNA polymerase sigma-70 factor (ECF subfamily)
LRLWERRSILPAATDIAGYFIRTGRNLAIDHGRRQRIAPFVQGVEHLEAIADRTPSPEDYAISRHELQRLQRAIDGLPPRAREVFVMARLDGLSYVEIGTQLGISPKTVFSHMVTALERLKAEVGSI